MKTGVLVRGLVLVLSLSLAACSSGKTFEKKEKSRAARDLGEAYMRNGEYTRALRELLKAEKIYAKDPFLQNDLGYAYLAKNNPDLAIAHFKEALKLKPDYAAARNNLGTAYMEKENWKAAIECFRQVVDDLLYPTPHFALSNLGFVYYKLEDYDRAAAYYNEALEIKPDFPKALNGLGLVYMAMGDCPAAIAMLEQAVASAPKEAPLYLDLGQAYKSAQQYRKAYDTFNKAAEIAQTPRLKQEAEKEAEKVWTLE
jgi:type IV pilus assembly protein PilF